MPLVPPTLDQFKEQHARAFPFAVPSYGATGVASLVSVGGGVSEITVTAGGVLYQNVPVVRITGGEGTGAEATAVITKNSVSSITVTAAGTGYREAPLVTIVSQDGDDTDLSKVTNKDIEFAMAMTPPNVNKCFFGDQASYGAAFNLLAAHYLCTNLLNSTQGVKSQYDWLATSRTVGNVSSSFGIPDRVLKSAFFSALTSTRYGAMYVAQIWPYLAGNVRGITGVTTP